MNVVWNQSLDTYYWVGGDDDENEIAWPDATGGKRDVRSPAGLCRHWLWRRWLLSSSRVCLCSPLPGSRLHVGGRRLVFRGTAPVVAQWLLGGSGIRSDSALLRPWLLRTGVPRL